MKRVLPNGRSYNPGAGFVRLNHTIMDSPAWRSLSSDAQALWLHIWRLYNGRNNGELFLSVRDASARLNRYKDIACDAFNELEEKGFIKKTGDSSFHVKTKKARCWALTSERIGNKPATNDWKNWKDQKK